jgi:hypothetical protein
MGSWPSVSCGCGHLNNLNKELQRKDEITADMYDSSMTFEVKLRLWKDQLQLSNAVYFPHLKYPGHNLFWRYSTKFPDHYLCQQELERFKDFKIMEAECLNTITALKSGIEKAQNICKWNLFATQYWS